MRLRASARAHAIGGGHQHAQLAGFCQWAMRHLRHLRLKNNFRVLELLTEWFSRGAPEIWRAPGALQESSSVL